MKIPPLLWLVPLAIFSRDAVSESAPDFKNLQKAVVAVLAKAVSPAQGNKPVATQGTGFFISKDGFLVTSLHLITELGAVSGDSVQYEIRFPPPSTAVYQATPIFTNPAADILVLYAGVADLDVKTLERTDRTGVVAGSTAVFTMGYPAGYNISFDRGVIKSFAGPISPIPVWASSLTFKSGQSGSPIILENGKVIAIAKGNDGDATSIGLIVPTRLIPAEFWDGLSSETGKAYKLASLGNGSEADRVIIEASAPAPIPKQSRKRTVPLEKYLAPCQDTVTEHNIIQATTDWVIDPASVQVFLSSISGGGGQAIIKEVSSSTIDIVTNLRAPPCTRIFGIVTNLGPSAHMSAVVNFTETRNGSTSDFFTVSDVKAVGPVKVPIPDLPPAKLRYSILSTEGTKAAFSPGPGEIKEENGARTLDIQAVKSRIK